MDSSNGFFSKLKDYYDGSTNASKVRAGFSFASDVSEITLKDVQRGLMVDSLNSRIAETALRATINSRQISEQTDKVVAEQQMQFLASGVRLEGSALEVLADTIDNFAEKQRNTQREFDYEIENLSVEKAFTEVARKYKWAEYGLAAGKSASILTPTK